MSRTPVKIFTPSNLGVPSLGGVNNRGRRRVIPPPVVLLNGAAQGREQTSDRQLDSLQQRVADASRAARSNPLLDGNLIMNIPFTSGTPAVISHQLGRAYTSCFLLGQSAPGSIAVQRPCGTPGSGSSIALRTQVSRPLNAQNVLDTFQITVTPNFTGYADLWVF